MRKERDWVDYTALGLEAAQLAKLSGIAASLERMEQATLAERIEERELDNKRQMVILAEQLLGTLSTDGSINPQRKYLITFEIERDLRRGRVIPAQRQWSAWNDLDRVVALEQKIEAARETLGRALPNDQKAEADTAWKYMLEDFDLCWLIRYRDNKETLQTSRTQLEKISALLQDTSCDGKWRRKLQLERNALRVAIKRAEANQQHAAEFTPPDIDEEDERKLIQQFAESSVDRLKVMQQSRRELISRVLGGAFVSELQAQQRAEEQDDTLEAPQVPSLPMRGALLGLIVLAALSIGLFYGGLSATGIIGDPNGKDEGTMLVGCLLMFFGVLSLGAGIRLVYKSVAKGVH